MGSAAMWIIVCTRNNATYTPYIKGKMQKTKLIYRGSTPPYQCWNKYVKRWCDTTRSWSQNNWEKKRSRRIVVMQVKNRFQGGLLCYVYYLEGLQGPLWEALQGDIQKLHES